MSASHSSYSCKEMEIGGICEANGGKTQDLRFNLQAFPGLSCGEIFQVYTEKKKGFSVGARGFHNRQAGFHDSRGLSDHKTHETVSS